MLTCYAEGTLLFYPFEPPCTLIRPYNPQLLSSEYPSPPPFYFGTGRHLYT